MYYSRSHNNSGLLTAKKIVFNFITFSCVLAFISAIYHSSTAFAAGLPVFPGAEGFGTDTRAAYGGGSDPYVYKVTNLNASGAGSLRQCIEDDLNKGPRICVFEVSGTIKVTSDIGARDPYLTIAGQTAPSPGITVRGAAIHIGTHDVLIQHIRIRVGDEPGGPSGSNRDGLKIANSSGNVYNVVADHISVSWGIDENIQIWNPFHDITVSNSISSEALNCSIHNEGCHSMGFIIGYQGTRTSVIKNLMAHNRDRNPNIQSSTEVINNIIYNYGTVATRYISRVPSPTDGSVIGNIYKTGPDTRETAPITFKDYGSPDRLYLHDNMENGVAPADPWSLAANIPTGVKVTSPPIAGPGLKIMSVNRVESYLLANVGARPADRDAVDKRIINEYKTGTGKIIDSQSEVGGWPALANNRRNLTIPANPHMDNDGDGYTNLEEWLHAFAADVEGNSNFSYNTPNPPQNLRIIN